MTNDSYGFKLKQLKAKGKKRKLFFPVMQISCMTFQKKIVNFYFS